MMLYLQNRKELYSFPKGIPEPVSIVVPCYNEKEHIGKTIESLLSLDYPKNMIEIIIVDDKSTDNSVQVVKRYMKKYKNVRLIVNKSNSGGAAEPTNIGIKAAKYDYVAVADADSTPERDALIKMIGFLQNDDSVGGVTCTILTGNRNIFIEKLQAIEYTIIAFTRKLLDLVDSVYVTPGPFALYKKKVLLEIGLFDTKNLTQDIEIAWRMIYRGYKARMCLAARTHSVVPSRFKSWFKQRIRWNIGGLQTLAKYKGFIFSKGLFGMFIIPFFVIGLVVGIAGLFIYCYLFVKRIWITYFSTKFSLYLGTEIVKFSELNLNPSILNFFGIALFLIGFAFAFLGLFIMRESEIAKKHSFSFIFYIFIYLTIYPIILITSFYKFILGRYSW